MNKIRIQTVKDLKKCLQDYDKAKKDGNINIIIKPMVHCISYKYNEKLKHLIIKPRSTNKKTTPKQILEYIKDVPDKANVWVDLINSPCHLGITVDKDAYKTGLILIPDNGFWNNSIKVVSE